LTYPSAYLSLPCRHSRHTLRSCPTRRSSDLRTIGMTLLVVTATAALGALLVRDQISRHRRDLFSPHPLRRLAALGYLGSAPPSVDLVLLLRDFIASESRPLIRKPASAILVRMEEGLAARAASSEIAG